MKTKAKITRKDTREHLAQFHLACELVKVIHHYFPGLLSLLRRLDDPRDQRYITYESHVLLMTPHPLFYILYQQHEKNKPGIQFGYRDRKYRISVWKAESVLHP